MRPSQRARAASAEDCCPSLRCRSSVLAAPAARESQASSSPSSSSYYRCDLRRTAAPPRLPTCAPCAPAPAHLAHLAHLRTSTLAPLQAFVAERSVDVVLVAKSRQMLSAAQSIRIRLEPPASVQAPPILSPTLITNHQRAGRGRSIGGAGAARAAALTPWRQVLMLQPTRAVAGATRAAAAH
jgi:hypothetical protein